MSYVKLIVLALDLINKWVDWAKAQGYIAEGEAREIVRSAASIQAKVKVADEIRNEVDRLSESAVDDGLLELGRTAKPKPPTGAGR